MVWLIEFAFFGCLVGYALRTGWANSDIRCIALALAVSFLVSNGVAEIGFEWRPIFYPVLDVGVGLMAAGAWMIHRDRTALAIIALATLSASVSVAYSFIVDPAFGQQYLYVLLTNVFFAGQCLLTIWWGKRDARTRGDNINRVTDLSGAVAESSRRSVA